MQNNSFVTQRLMRDLAFVKRNPIVGASMQPLENDVFEWHGNVLLHGTVFHFVCVFPKSYPNHAPGVALCNAVPHPNVDSKGVLCCEVLGNTRWNENEVLDRWNGWSSSYGPYSVLLALQTLDFDLQEGAFEQNGITLVSACDAARKVTCKKCGHNAPEGKFVPALPTESASHMQVFAPLMTERAAETPKANAKKAKALNSNNDENIEKIVHAAPKKAKAPVAAAAPVSVETNANNNNNNNDNVEKKVAKKQPVKAVLAAAPSANVAPVVVSKPKPKKKKVKKAEEGWIEVGVPKKKKVKAAPAVVAAPIAVAKKENKPAVANMKKVVVAEKPEYPVGYCDEEEEKKRLAREKRKLREHNKKLEARHAREQQELEQKQKQKAAAEAKQQQRSKVVAYVPATKKTVAVVPASSTSGTPMGHFRILNKDTVCYILGFLAPRDVLRVAQSCKGLHDMASNVFLWRDLYGKQYSQVPRHLADFRRLYMMRLEGVASELVCFHTKLSFHDEDAATSVFGYGVDFTRNPKTNRVDYIDLTADVMSSDAFVRLNVRKGAHGEQIRTFLPLYVNEKHFLRSIPLLKRCAAELYNDLSFEEGVLQMLCCALNTRSVLLADKGVASCYQSVSSFAQLYRLLLAVCEEFPRVQRIVDNRVQTFMASERNREKDSVSSLGEFIPLLLCTRRNVWPKLKFCLVKEVLARNVLWACRHCPSLAQLDGLDQAKLLTEFWAGTVVSNRLIMLNTFFLTQFRPAGADDDLSSIARRLDRLYGNVPSSVFNVSKRATAAILADSANWALYFKVVCGTTPTKAAVESLLRDAVRDSRRKGYHSAKTNFAAVHSSGTSRILQKGQSYVMQKDVESVMLSLGWCFPRGTTFLDASVMFYDASLKMVAFIDYQSVVNELLGEAAMHSGDTIEGNTGQHNVLINLNLVPSNIQTLYLVLSAWTGDLSQVTQPHVRLTDVKSQGELCQYTLESAGSSQAVVMAKIVRTFSTGWKVIPVGVTCNGTVRSYANFDQAIHNIERTGRKEE